MNWFGGELIVTRTNGVRVSFHDVTFTEAQRILNEQADVREAMYHPYPTMMERQP